MPKTKSKQVLPTDIVLSVRQPYAQLLVTPSEETSSVPIKWIENRSWEPSLNPDECHWILIHASAAKDHPSWYEDFGLRIENCAHGAIIGYAHLIGWKRLHLDSTDKASKSNDKVFDNHCSELSDIVEKHAGVRPNHGFDQIGRARNIVHWIFVDPVMLDKPIFCPGKLRLWKLPENLI